MYYRLTFISSRDKTRIGDTILNGNKPLSIGQTMTCDVQLPESEQYEPDLYATILPLEDAKNQSESSEGWYLVRRTDGHRVAVNGKEVSIAITLHNGDILSFIDGENKTELKFDMLDDGEYDTNNGFVYKKHTSNKRFFLIAIAFAALALGVAAYALFASRQKDLRHEDLRPFRQSIYHITTDSVYLLCEVDIDNQRKQIVIDSIELERAAEGTAFLTSDSLFVTARHCIEPWINDEEWDGTSSKSKMSPEVRLATKAETENRIAGYDKYTLRSHCIISKGLERYDYHSTDFCMNKSRDMVMRLGNAQDAVYWRTIFPIAHRRDMELGDFAYIKFQQLYDNAEKSQVRMAEWDEIVQFSQSGIHDIAVIGYPLNDNGTDSVSVVYGNLMTLEYNDSTGCPIGCIPLSAPINPGNSGGPVVAKIGKEIKVIGIVSKADGLASQGVFWAVPITEVLDMHKKGDKAKVDSVTYRR